MKIIFNGAARTVTGSQYLLKVNSQTLLLECGLFQGHRQDTYERNLNFRFLPPKVDAVILSHAHIDHSGNLPNLVKQGYPGSIFTTPATARLADLMLRDSGHIQESDIAFVNRKRAQRGEEPLEPLYTIEDAEQVPKHFKPIEYGQTFQPIPGVTACLFEAGHILGSAAIQLDIEENGKKLRLWFSGDIGRIQMPLLRDPVLPSGVDVLMMECTYGDTPHPSYQQAEEDLHRVVSRTVERGGKVIIPAFAVGRTQELVYGLNRMISEGRLPSVPVYVDSPLAVATSKIFDEFPRYYDEESLKFINEKRHPALHFKGLTYIQSVDESKALNDRRDPMVIISASGMAESGRILHHLRNNIENPRNTVVLVSWQAPDTLGRRLAEHQRQVRIFGETYDRRCEVESVNGFSAHAGQDMLLKYAQAVKGRAKQFILVHGELSPAAVFSQMLKDAGISQIAYPDLFEEMEL